MQRCILNGNAEYEDGNLQRAYMLYFRAAVIYLEIMPQHAGFKDPKFSAVKVCAQSVQPAVCLLLASSDEPLASHENSGSAR